MFELEDISDYVYVNILVKFIYNIILKVTVNRNEIKKIKSLQISLC